jgi:hypothetical protein
MEGGCASCPHRRRRPDRTLLRSPKPADVLPEDELLSFGVEAQLKHEKELRGVLEALRGDNDALEAVVAAPDARARKVKAAITARIEAVARVRGWCPGRGLGEMRGGTLAAGSAALAGS